MWLFVLCYISYTVKVSFGYQTDMTYLVPYRNPFTQEKFITIWCQSSLETEIEISQYWLNSIQSDDLDDLQRLVGSYSKGRTIKHLSNQVVVNVMWITFSRDVYESIGDLTIEMLCRQSDKIVKLNLVYKTGAYRRLVDHDSIHGNGFDANRPEGLGKLTNFALMLKRKTYTYKVSVATRFVHPDVVMLVQKHYTPSDTTEGKSSYRLFSTENKLSIVVLRNGAAIFESNSDMNLLLPSLRIQLVQNTHIYFNFTAPTMFNNDMLESHVYGVYQVALRYKNAFVPIYSIFVY